MPPPPGKRRRTSSAETAPTAPTRGANHPDRVKGQALLHAGLAKAGSAAVAGAVEAAIFRVHGAGPAPNAYFNRISMILSNLRLGDLGLRLG